MGEFDNYDNILRGAVFEEVSEENQGVENTRKSNPSPVASSASRRRATS